MKKIICLIALNVFLLTAIALLQACTISFKNVSTHGTNTDLIDEEQQANPEITAPVTL